MHRSVAREGRQHRIAVPVAGRESFGLLRRLLTQGRTRQGLPNEHPPARRLHRLRTLLWQPAPAGRPAFAGASRGAIPDTNPHAYQWATSGVAAQIHSHHRQPPRPAHCRQCSEPALHSSHGQCSLGLGHHLHPHAQWLAVPGGGAGSVLAQDCRLGHGAEHACRTGVLGLADGHYAAPTAGGPDRAFRPGPSTPAKPTVPC